MDNEKVNSASAMVERIRTTFKVTTQNGEWVSLWANRAQRTFEERCGQRNIVMKSRQQGMTTWLIARSLLHCTDHPGIFSVGAFGNFESAHCALDVARVMLKSAGLPHRSDRNSIILANDSRYYAVSAQKFNGWQGRTVDNLHAAELAWWDGNAGYEFLVDTRRNMNPHAEETLESYPSPTDTGLFRGEWETAAERGAVRHFLPWWMNENLTGEAPEKDSLTDVECGLILREGLTLEQIGFRRKLIGDGIYPPIRDSDGTERPGYGYLEREPE